MIFIWLQMDILKSSLYFQPHFFPVSALALCFAGRLTSIVSVSVSFVSWMFRGITPSAGTGKSISSETVSFGGGRPDPEKLDTFDWRGRSWTSSSFTQLHRLCLRCITDTWTVFCWSSGDGGWSSYVDIFSYATKTTSVSMLLNVLLYVEHRYIEHRFVCVVFACLKYRNKDGFSLPWQQSSERASVFGDGQESKLYIWTLQRSPLLYCYMWDLKEHTVMFGPP